jgi:Mg/Co/Ni transporter MgtE
MSPRAAWRLEAMGFERVYDYVAGKQDWLAEGLPTEGRIADVPRAGSLARTDVPTARIDEGLGEVRARVEGSKHDTAVVTNDHGVVLGLLRPDQLDGDADARVEEVMRPGPSTFRPHVFITEMAEFLQRHDLQSVPITTGEGVLVGLLRRDDAVRAAEELHRGHRHEH